MGYSKRAHNERYPEYSWKRTFAQTPKWLKRVTNKLIRQRGADRAEIRRIRARTLTGSWL